VKFPEFKKVTYILYSFRTSIRITWISLNIHSDEAKQRRVIPTLSRAGLVKILKGAGSYRKIWSV
jgi:hypothetical protein